MNRATAAVIAISVTILAGYKSGLHADCVETTKTFTTLCAYGIYNNPGRDYNFCAEDTAKHQGNH